MKACQDTLLCNVFNLLCNGKACQDTLLCNGWRLVKILYCVMDEGLSRYFIV